MDHYKIVIHRTQGSVAVQLERLDVSEGRPHWSIWSAHEFALAPEGMTEREAMARLMEGLGAFWPGELDDLPRVLSRPLEPRVS